MKRLLALSTLILTTGCGALTPGDVKQNFSLDGVKNISPAVTDPYDPSTYLQDQYSVSQSSRLLLRFEKLSENRDKILVDDKHRVTVQVSSEKVDSTVAANATRIRLCPLTRNWMILATWSQAVPGIGPAGDWVQAGGDFDSTACVNAALKDSAASTLWTFDMSDWFLDYLKGRQGVNYGLILIAESGLKVFGEKSSNKSPRIQYSETSTFP